MSTEIMSREMCGGINSSGGRRLRSDAGRLFVCFVMS